jgi:putative transposase
VRDKREERDSRDASNEMRDARFDSRIPYRGSGIAQRFPIEKEAIGTDKNHIHLLCRAHPKAAPGRIVQIFKSIMAREIARRKPAVKRALWGGEFGPRGTLWLR